MSAKIQLDKYYTPEDVVDECLNSLNENLNKINFFPSIIIEPSAGNGSFSNKIKNCIAYDISPEADGIIKADFLKLDLKYKKGTLIIGNPPFGNKHKLLDAFYKKSIILADCVAFIMPISQLNNSRYFYEFDLISSLDLGLRDYSGKKLHCCFNIYFRPKYGLNKRPTFNLKCVEIVRQDSKKFNTFEYDLKLAHWGTGCAGRILKDDENVSGMYKIRINPLFKDKVIEVLKNANWKKELKNISMLSLRKYHIIELLRREIPEIY